jgi:threonine/homoserine/homoserine lactone efflux protein
MNSSVFIVSGLFAFLAAISPGPDFALVSKNSLLVSRKIGIYTAIGIALGLSLHVLYALLGFSVIIKESVLIYSIIKYAGSSYLAFLGVQLLISCKTQGAVLCGINNLRGHPEKLQLSSTRALLSGLLCNALNPKASLFILSFFSQIIDQGMPRMTQLGIALEIIAITFLWFSVLATILSHQMISKKFIEFQKYVSIAMGIFLISFSIKLAFF